MPTAVDRLMSLAPALKVRFPGPFKVLAIEMGFEEVVREAFPVTERAPVKVMEPPVEMELLKVETPPPLWRKFWETVQGKERVRGPEFTRVSGPLLVVVTEALIAMALPVMLMPLAPLVCTLAPKVVVPLPLV